MEKCCGFNSARLSSNRDKHECWYGNYTGLGSKTVAFVVGNGGAITITASPPITTTGMIVGQELRVCGTSNTNTVTYNNSVNLVLNGSATLGKDQCLNLMYAGTDGTNLSWIETGRNF